MTSNATPKPYVTSAGYDTVLGYAWEATTPTSSWYLYLQGGEEWGWWIIDLSEELQTVKRYGLYGLSNIDYPVTWYLYGSQNSEDWAQLDYKAGQGAPIVSAWTDYEIDNDTAYRYYKLYIVAVSTNNCSIRLHFCGPTEAWSSSSSNSSSSTSSVEESHSSSSSTSTVSNSSASSESSESSP